MELAEDAFSVVIGMTAWYRDLKEESYKQRVQKLFHAIATRQPSWSIFKLTGLHEAVYESKSVGYAWE